MRFLTAGESHGKGLTVIVEGMPAGIPISLEKIHREMQKRRQDFGRGGRGMIEDDEVEILSGIRQGKTIGSPICLFIPNKDYKNWKEKIESEAAAVTQPRPGHADLAGVLKYGFDDVRNVLERASARETAARVAAGSLFKQFLEQFAIDIASHTIQIGTISLQKKEYGFDEIKSAYEIDPEIRCIDPSVSKNMKNEIQQVRLSKNTLGGVTETWAVNVPVGLGSYVHFDRKIDGQIAQAIMSIPSVKAVEIGEAIAATSQPGSAVHDEIFYTPEKGYYRKTNRAGGIEGGVTNGMPIVIKTYYKPISTLYKPLKTVDILTKQPSAAVIERSDVCVVPRAAVISEAMLAYVLAKNITAPADRALASA